MVGLVGLIVIAAVQQTHVVTELVLRRRESERKQQTT
jgi:hypothetical protein